MNNKHWLLLKFLALNSNEVFSEKEIPKNISSQFDYGMDLINHLYQLSVKGLIDKVKNKMNYYKINSAGLDMVNSVVKQETELEKYNSLLKENEALRNKELLSNKRNSELDNDLKAAQYQLTTLQIKAEQNKKKYGILGAIFGAIVTIIANNLREILQFLHITNQ